MQTLTATNPRGAVERTRRGLDPNVDWPEWAAASVAEGSVASITGASDWTRTLGKAPYWESVDWDALCAAIRAVHLSADTFTSDVKTALDSLRDPDTVVLRVAHTPDWLPYRSVALLPILLNELAMNAAATQGARAVQLFLVVDTDNACDRRMRRAVMPDCFHNQGELVLATGFSRRQSGFTVAHLPPPSTDRLEALAADLSSHVARHLVSLGISRTAPEGTFLHATLEKIQAELLIAARTSRSLGEFNTVWLSRLVNRYWGLPTLFVPHTTSAPYLYGCFDRLAKEQRELAGVNQSRLRSPEPPTPNFFWLVCMTCGSREAVSISPDGTASAKCPGCQRQLLTHVGDPCSTRECVLAPRLAADAMLDGLLWNSPLGVSYTGSTSHVLKHLEAGGSPPIDVLWAAAGSVLGAPELAARFSRRLSGRTSIQANSRSVEASRAAQGRASVVYDLLYDGYDSTRDRWQTSLRGNGLNSPPAPRATWLDRGHRGGD